VRLRTGRKLLCHPEPRTFA